MKKLKVGIVGLGRISGNHFSEIGALPDLFKIVAMCDTDPERIARRDQLTPGLKAYDSIDKLLKDDEIDMVTICTRHPDHAPMAHKILAAGKIAVVEKPTATSAKELENLIAYAKKKGGHLFFRHNRRYEAVFQKAKALMDSGIIGDVQYIKVHRCADYCRRNDWMTMTDFYGGLLSNWGPHVIDQALQYLDSPVTEIWSDLRRSISIGDGDDLMKILIRGANGRLADVELSGCNALPGRQLEVIGTRGCLVFDGGKQIEVRAVEPTIQFKKLKPHPGQPAFAYGNFDEKLEFVDSFYDVPQEFMGQLWIDLYNDVVKGIPTPVRPEQALAVMKVIDTVFKQNKWKPILSKWTK